MRDLLREDSTKTSPEHQRFLYSICKAFNLAKQPDLILSQEEQLHSEEGCLPCEVLEI